MLSSTVRLCGSVSPLDALTVFARRAKYGLTDGVWYALKASPEMASCDCSALCDCVRFGLDQDDLKRLARRALPERLRRRHAGCCAEAHRWRRDAHSQRGDLEDVYCRVL